MGMTETGPTVFLMDPAHAAMKIGSVGKPQLLSQVRLVDAEGRDVAAGEKGEILFRGPGVTPGYFNNPGATAASPLFIYFMGGGACWDASSCLVLNTAVHGPFGQAQWEANGAPSVARECRRNDLRMFGAQAAARDRPTQHSAVPIALRLVVEKLGETKQPARRTARDQRHVELPICALPSHDDVGRRLGHLKVQDVARRGKEGNKVSVNFPYAVSQSQAGRAIAT
jgi:hypothetical protein